mgnify:CR=1 FL=1
MTGDAHEDSPEQVGPENDATGHDATPVEGAGANPSGQRCGLVGFADFFFLDQTVQAAGHGGHHHGRAEVG